MGEKKQKVNIPMCAAFILFVLTLISMHLTSGLFARYTVTATGSDSARVAKFDVQGDAVLRDVILDCRNGSSTGEYIITVTNNSEVAIRYSFTLDFTEQLPGTAVLVKMGENQGSATNDNKTLTFSNVGTLGPNAGPQQHTLEFIINNWSHVTSRENGGVQGEQTANWKLDFTVSVTAEQID